VQEQLCGREPQSKQDDMLVVALVASLLAVFAIILRLGSRHLVSKRLWADDITISIVGILVIPYAALAVWSKRLSSTSV
jgi:arginine exporter protein ArgO